MNFKVDDHHLNKLFVCNEFVHKAVENFNYLVVSLYLQSSSLKCA